MKSGTTSLPEGQTLDPIEWDFFGFTRDRLPEDQIKPCATYELCRESEEMRGAVAKMRDPELRPEFLRWAEEDLLLPASVLEKYQAFVEDCTEFPDTPWLGISPGKRREWTVRFREHWTGEHQGFNVITDPEVLGQHLNAIQIALKKRDSMVQKQDGLFPDPHNPERMFFLCAVDFNIPVESTLKAFEAWRRANKPKGITTIKNRDVRTYQEHLKSLAALRLHKVFRRDGSSCGDTFTPAGRFFLEPFPRNDSYMLTVTPGRKRLKARSNRSLK